MELKEISLISLISHDCSNGFGYYDFNRSGTRWLIAKYIELTDAVHYRVDDRLAVIFADQHDQWWIGAYWQDDQEWFDIMGPYDTSADAYVMLTLVGSK